MACANANNDYGKTFCMDVLFAVHRPVVWGVFLASLYEMKAEKVAGIFTFV